MSSLICFCENPACGAVFEAPNIVEAPPEFQMTFVGVIIGPCPVCGGAGRVPDGLCKVADEVFSLLTGPKSSVESIRQIEEVVRNSNGETKEAVLREIRSASVELSDALWRLPCTSNLPQWLGIVLTFLSLAYGVYVGEVKPTVDEKPDYRDQLIERLLDWAPNGIFNDQRVKIPWNS